MTRIKNFLEKEQEITQAQVKVRATKIEEIWKAFNDNQTNIETQRSEDEEHLEEILRAEEGERIVFEQVYYEAVDKVHSVLTAIQQVLAIAYGPQNHINDRANPSMLDIKLSMLKLVTFNGTYEQWMLFKDFFISIIHDNPKLSEIISQKFLKNFNI